MGPDRDDDPRFMSRGLAQAASRGEPRPPRLAWRRAVVLCLPLLYVAGSAVKSAEPSPRAWLALAGALVIALFGARLRPEESAENARGRLWTSAALSLTVASAALSERWPWLAAAREIALLGAGIAAARSIAAIESDQGLAAHATEARARGRGFGADAALRFAIAIGAVAWGSAGLVDSLTWIGRGRDLGEAGPMLAAAGGALALFGLGASALVVARARGLELGAPPRALACAGAASVGLFAAMTAAMTTALQADAAAALGAAIAYPLVVRIAHAPDALALARRGRRLLALALFGGPVAMVAGIAAEGHAPGIGVIVMILALGAAAVGSVAAKLEEPLLPAKGRLLDALAEGTRAAHERDARTAIATALTRLRQAAGHGAASPELWILHPTRICTVDAAGYLQEKPGELPASLIDVLQSEPRGTVRVDVLSALEVRRADLRPLLRWLEDRGALFATLIEGAEEPDGVIIVPAGARNEPLTIDEMDAALHFASAFVAVCHGRSARERHLEREQLLAARVEELDDELAALKHSSSLDASRSILASARLARPATVGIYSAASRMAYDALERRIQSSAPAVVVARAGVDPVPYIARAHLVGPRKEGPLVIVDGTSSREHDLERWKDPLSSPLALADRGLLVLVDGAALPRDVQLLIARTLSERRPPWERATPIDAAIALTATSTPDTLVDYGLLAPELFSRFEDATPIELPGLRERSEDLFSIVADRLAREGLRVYGRPFGIDAAAFAKLVEHPFEGEDAELAAVVTRLVACAHGDVVRASDVEAIGLTPPTPPKRRADEAERAALSSSSHRNRRS